MAEVRSRQTIRFIVGLSGIATGILLACLFAFGALLHSEPSGMNGGATASAEAVRIFLCGSAFAAFAALLGVSVLRGARSRLLATGALLAGAIAFYVSGVGRDLYVAHVPLIVAAVFTAMAGCLVGAAD